MKTKMNRLLSMLLVCVTALALMPVLSTLAEETPEIVASGTCGSNLTWVLDTDYTLTISGEGATGDYIHDYRPARTPWHNYLAQIRSVVIEDGVTRIGNSAFQYCTSLSSVTIPDSVTSIGDNVFERCRSLTSVTVPNGVEKISINVFKDCSSLETVILPQSVTAFYSAFEGCSALKRITIPDGATSIGASAFKDCVSLTEVTIPDSVVSIIGGAFMNCKSLTDISISKNISRIDGGSFADCTSLESFDLDEENPYFEVDGSGCLYDEGKTRILCFACGAPTTDITVPQTVKYIYQNAFKGAENLKSITIPYFLTEIGAYAFANCAALETVTISDLLFINRGVFSGCSSLKNVTLPENLTRIDANAFLNCTALESIRFPGALRTLSYDEGAFTGCRSLSSITVEEGNPYFYSVDNCMIRISDNALVLACKTSVIPTDGRVKVINDYAFASAPEVIILPSVVQRFKTNIFTGCTDLKIAVFEPGITETPEVCLPNSVTKIVIPDTVTRINTVLCRNSTGVYGYRPQNTSYDLEIYYTGTEAQWNRIDIDNGAEAYPNQNIINAPKHFNYQFQTVAGTLPTQTEHGYTEGVFCDVAGLYLSGHEVIHNPGAAVCENEVPATCTAGGEYDEAVYCTVCGDELSRTYVTVNANGHTPGAAVRENEIPAACTAAGEYDEVVYCAACPNELSRTHVEVAATGHSWGEWEVIRKATEDEEGLMRRTCANDPSHVEEEVIPKLQPTTNVFQQFIQRIRDFFSNIMDWFSRLFSF